jgi:hypothetical protein
MLSRPGAKARLAHCAALVLVAAAAHGQLIRDPNTLTQLQRRDGHVWDLAIKRVEAVRPLRARALRRAIEDHRAGRADLRRDLAVTWGEFLAGTGEPFLALALDRPADGELEPGREVTLFGELTDAAGAIIASFETEDEVELAAGRALVDVPLALPVSAARGLFGIAVRGKARWLVEQELEPRAIDPGTFGLSRAVLSLDVHPLPERQRPDDPFCFGGLRVAPHGARVFTPSDAPWLFVVVRSPGSGSGPAPSLAAELLIRAEGEASPRRYPVAAATPIALRGFQSQWGLGIPLPVAGLEPGDYEASLVVSEIGRSGPATAEARFTVAPP